MHVFNEMKYLEDAQRKGEISSAYIRFGIIGLAALLLLMATFLAEISFFYLFVSSIPLISTLTIANILILKYCKTGFRYKWVRYISTALDITVISGILFGIAVGQGEPELVTNSLMANLYFIVIALSAMKKSANVVYFGGILATVQYAGFIIWAYSLGLFNIFHIASTDSPTSITTIKFQIDDGIALSLIPAIVGIVLGLYVKNSEKLLLEQAKKENELEKLQVSFFNQIDSANKSIGESSKDLDKSVNEASNVILSLNKTFLDLDKASSRQVESVNNTSDNVSILIDSVNEIKTVAQKQSELVEKSSSAVREISASIQSTADISTRAETITIELQNAAQTGIKSASHIIEFIKEMEERSQAIIEFVEIIRGISEQTDLLAMNAAIEAAHAGDAGKGFSVVAEEIRKLAENSANSASDIAVVITDISEMIKSSVDLSEEAEKGLKQIIDDVANTKSINQEIAQSMQEQSKAGQEIIHSMEELLQISQSAKGIAAKQFDSSKMIENVLTNLKESTQEIVNYNFAQSKKSKELNNTIDNLKNVHSNNLKLIDNFTNIINSFEFASEEIVESLQQAEEKKSIVPKE